MRVKDENKRLAIYHAAMEIVNSNGLANTSMSKIARTAGVSASTIYVYFENKEDMLNKLYLMVKEESSAELFRGFSEDIGVKEGLALYMGNLFSYMQAHPVKFSFQEQFINSPSISPETKEKGLECYAPLYRLFMKGLEQKLVKDYPPVLIGTYIYAPIMRLVKIHLDGELYVDDDILKKAIEMAWKAVSV